MSHPQLNDTVALAFTGKLDNGEIFISQEESKPLLAQIGSSDLPPTLEQEIQKMAIGERRKVRVPPEEGFGPRQKELVQTIDNPGIVEKLQPKPGMILSLKVDKDGVEQNVPATVIEVEGTRVTVDYNHPCAGHHLTYEVVLVDIKR
ncbi:MAG: FKBP-type peptidyl-prolyl cis-trans isomerase [Desulforhopalus sp.]